MFVIPMAGESNRFRQAGYGQPKFMLPLAGQSVFSWALCSFRRYFETEKFLFVARQRDGLEEFLGREGRELGVRDYELVLLDQATGGQGDTVYEGLSRARMKQDTPISIFNIDTFRPGFAFSGRCTAANVDGYLETFVGAGKNWSNVVPAAPGSDQVKFTAEKTEASEYCCTGFYHWRSAKQFVDVVHAARKKPAVEGPATETYVAPMYNTLIAAGGNVRFTTIEREQVIFCGVPAEYEALCANPKLVTDAAW